jgi:hypothetical protein
MAARKKGEPVKAPVRPALCSRPQAVEGELCTLVKRRMTACILPTASTMTAPEREA